MLKTFFVGILFGFTFSVQAQLDYVGPAYTKNLPFNYDAECAKKCGNAPRLVDLPAIDEVNFISEVAKATNWNKCMNKCNALRVHVDERKKDLEGQGPTIASLIKELNACQSQLQLVQEKGPTINSTLTRDVQKLKEHRREIEGTNGAVSK